MHTRIAIAVVVLCGGGAAAQNADAIVVKIPAASMPSTVTLSMAGGNGLPGKALTIPITLAFSGTAAPSSFQIDVAYDATKLTFVSAAPLTATAISAGVVRLALVGQSAMASGVVGSAIFTMIAGTEVTLFNCMSASFGMPLSTGCSGGTVAVATCTVTGDATASVADVQAMVNQALGVMPAVNDLNLDRVVSVVDVQMVVGAALGKGCVV